MPITKDKKALYPPDWDAISLAAKERAGWRCQWEGCGACQYAVGHWRQERGIWVWQPVEGYAGRGLLPMIGTKRWTYKEAQQYAAELDWPQSEEGPKPIVIVLTTMHLNHDPSDCRPENLKVACQRHHLAFDAPLHAKNAWRTRRAKSGTAELF
jgi:hypothetical protein